MVNDREAVAQIKKRSRPDRSEAMSLQVDSGDNRKYLLHSMQIAELPEVDMKNPAEVQKRIRDYFNICAENDMKPSVAGIALAFSVDRKTFWAWANGIESDYIPAESRSTIKKAYALLNAQMENYMQNGKINPVAGIFLMKNNMGYKDQQEFVLTPNAENDAAAGDVQSKYKQIAQTQIKKGAL